jgi:hypothetical protein
MRQLARTVTDQKPFRSPVNGCSRKLMDIHVFDLLSDIQEAENVLDLRDVLGIDASSVGVFEERLHPL